MVARFRELSRQELDARQSDVFDALLTGPRQSVPKVFHIYLQNPKLADRIEKLGQVCRYEAQFGRKYTELAILLVAQHWNAKYEWAVHEPEALKAGVSETVISAIKEGITPEFSDAKAKLIYHFAKGALENNHLPDDVFRSARAAFGDVGVVELSAIIGYYSMLAITMRIFDLRP